MLRHVVAGNNNVLANNFKNGWPETFAFDLFMASTLPGDAAVAPVVLASQPVPSIKAIRKCLVT